MEGKKVNGENSVKLSVYEESVEKTIELQSVFVFFWKTWKLLNWMITSYCLVILIVKKNDFNIIIQTVYKEYNTYISVCNPKIVCTDFFVRIPHTNNFRIPKPIFGICITSQVNCR